MNQIDVPDDFANWSTRCDMQSEVAELINRGMNQIDACTLVGLSRRDFHMLSGSGPIPFLPTPSEIAAITERMRAGDLVCTVRSQRRWIAENQKLDAAGEDSDRFELAGRIAEDDCAVPDWLYSADKQPAPTT